MMRTPLLAALLALMLSSTQAAAFDLTSFFSVKDISGTVSLLGVMWHGLQVGTATGLSAGWVRYPNDGANINRSAGIGALAGIGFGIGAGLLGQNEGANRILSDMGFGSKVGGSAGLLAGTVTGLLQGKSEPVGNGTAWGQLAGAGLGLLYSGYRAASGTLNEEKKKPAIPTLPPVLGLAPSADGTLMLTYERRF